MVSRLKLGDIEVDVHLKDIKNIHLSVHPPTGRVRISAPQRMKLDTIRLFAISRLGWIRQQQKRIKEQERETPREYVERESHYVWGSRCLLHITEAGGAPSVELRHNKIDLSIRSGASAAKKEEILENWYRSQIRNAVPRLIAKWELRLGVKVAAIYVQKMKTKWGSCNTKRRTVRLNTDLAKKPPVCLEYIVVHEMLHIIEPTHNNRFIEMMDKSLPNWQITRSELNRLPVRHEEWGY